MLRLALVITELQPGGAERCLVNLATGIDRQKFQPVVYSLAPRPAQGRDLLAGQLEAADIPIHFLDLRSKWQAGSAISRLAGLLRQQQPDIVQTFLFHANVVGTLAARRAKVPRVVSGVRVADPRRWRWMAERWVTPKLDRIVCVSQSVADFCRDRCKFPPEKLVVIPNGVDVVRFRDAEPVDLASLGLPPDRKAILYVGRLDRQKGLDVLLRAATVFLKELPQHNLMLVGDGPERGRLERLAAERGLGERVHFTGFREDVPRLLAACELLVLPSRWEGMPNVILEAMAAGKPVVATQAEGVLEILGPLAEAQTVSNSEANAIANRILQIATNPQLSAKTGRLNQARAAECFSIPSMVGHYQRLYQAITAK